MALAVLGKFASGEDPNAKRGEEKRRTLSTVKELLDRYDQLLERRKYVTHIDVLSLLRSRLRPLLGRAISEVKTWEYAEIIERLDKRSGGTAGGTFRTHCSIF